MTIQGWVFFGILALFILSFSISGAIIFEKIVWKVLSVVAAMLLIIGLFAGMRWYYQNTASGQRAMTDQKSELGNGLERTVTIYTVDGEIIARYTGKLTLRAMTAATSSLTMRGSATPTITALWSLLRTLSRVRTKNYI